jgi:thiamine transport system ATP-binding protein
MLRVEGATVRFGTRAVVDHVDLEVTPGETVAVLGPSGSGKSTLLRAVAGLQRLDAGRITWDGSDLAPVPPHERRFGMTFQEYALFPHRNVRGNVEFGLRMAGRSRADRARRLAEVLDLVGMAAMADRPVASSPGCSCSTNRSARWTAPGVPGSSARSGPSSTVTP